MIDFIVTESFVLTI